MPAPPPCHITCYLNTDARPTSLLQAASRRLPHATTAGARPLPRLLSPPQTLPRAPSRQLYSAFAQLLRSCFLLKPPPRPPPSPDAAEGAPRRSKAPGPDYTVPSRNLALELVRVTEAAALASARWWVGRFVNLRNAVSNTSLQLHACVRLSAYVTQAAAARVDALVNWSRGWGWRCCPNLLALGNSNSCAASCERCATSQVTCAAPHQLCLHCGATHTVLPPPPPGLARVTRRQLTRRPST